MKRILSFLLFSFFALPWLCSASVTGINVADVSYVADADTINVTISYLYETPGEVAPQGFIIRLVGMDDLGYSFTSPAFGPLDFVPSDELATASYAITGLSASSSFSYTLDDAEPLVEIPYAYGTMETTATDGVFVDPGETVTPVGTPTDDAYYLLAPLPLEGIQTDAAGNQFLNIGANDGPTGPNFDFGDYVNGLLKFAIGIAGALAVVMIVIGGMQYMSTDNFGEKAQGKEQIKNAVGGILLLLGAYMILNTLNPNLVDFNFKVEQVSIEADPVFVLEHSDTNGVAVGGKECGGKYTVGTSWPSDVPPRKSSTEFVIPTVTGTSINKANCSVVSDTAAGGTNCTSVTDLKLTALQKIREKCPSCELVVTGGTECWLHSYTTAHGPGSEVIDLRNDASVPNLNNYIKGVGDKNKKGVISGWGTLYVIDDIEVVDEGDHYHVISSTGQGKATGKLKY